MGHYEGMEEICRAEREERDGVVKGLNSEQFVKLRLLDEQRSLKFQIDRLRSEYKANDTALKKLRRVSLPSSIESLWGHLRDYDYKIKYDKAVKELLSKLFNRD